MSTDGGGWNWTDREKRLWTGMAVLGVFVVALLFAIVDLELRMLELETAKAAEFVRGHDGIYTMRTQALVSDEAFLREVEAKYGPARGVAAELIGR